MRQSTDQTLPEPQTPAATLRDYCLLTLGTLLIAVGVYFFKFPNHFSTGGVSGISIILGHYAPGLSAGAFVLIINLALLALGYAVLGRAFGLRTTYCSLLFSLAIYGLEVLAPMSRPMTSQPLLELIFAVSLPAVGSALLFNLRASSGGTDIVAMILRKYTHLNIGNALFCVDFLITLAACVAFGMETGLFSLLGLMMKALLVDMVMENININKLFQIVTAKPEPIVRFIVEELHRGATEIKAEGAYTNEDKTIVMTAVNRAQAVRLRQYTKSVDPKSFVMITNTGEIIGKGFRGEFLG